MNSLKVLGQALREISTCPVCGKSKMVRAVAHRGHGTGQHGAVHYSATGYEQVSVETHCTCLGGPCDQVGLLAKPEPKEQLYELYDIDDEKVITTQLMTAEEARWRNVTLRRGGESMRWIEAVEEDKQ